MTKYGLTDLERGKYLPGGTELLSTVRTSPISYSVLPVESYRYQIRYFQTDGGATAMNINGSVTPVEFKFVPTTRSLVYTFTITSVAVNVQTITDYGNISGGIANGVYFYSYDGVTEIPFFNVRRWVEFTHATTAGSTTLNLNGNNTEDTMSATMLFKDPIVIEPGREIRVRIRDNLTGIKYQTATFILSEV